MKSEDLSETATLDCSEDAVRKAFMVFGAPAIGQAEIDEVVDTIRSGWLGTGPKTHRFEADFAAYTGAKHALALSSCTAGLELALDVLGVNQGDEVITTPMTFAATANVVAHRGAKPVFVDVERDSMNINPDLIEKAITPHTKAIIPVDMAGRPCAIDRIMEIAARHGVYVIQDAAHAAEAWHKMRKVGNIAHITAFSFYVTKNICTGEGGMLTTNDDKWAEELRVKSLHGISKDAWKRYSAEGFQPYETIYPGYKFNMMDIQASMGIHQLAHVEDTLKIREHYWSMYDEAFADMPELITPLRDVSDGSRHARHLYTLLLNLETLPFDRNAFVDEMKKQNIGTGVHFTALHLHKYYHETFGYTSADCPNASWIGERTVSLPLSVKMTEADVADVIRAVTRVVASTNRSSHRRSAGV